jgi:hypothetical protein
VPTFQKHVFTAMNVPLRKLKRLKHDTISDANVFDAFFLLLISLIAG